MKTGGDVLNVAISASSENVNVRNVKLSGWEFVIDTVSTILVLMNIFLSKQFERLYFNRFMYILHCFVLNEMIYKYLMVHDVKHCVDGIFFFI